MPKRFLTAFAAALIALCIVGVVSAQSTLTAPTGVTVVSTGEGFVVSWDASDAASHWVAWMSDADYQAARADDWTTALNYDHVPSGKTQHVAPPR